MPRRGEGEIIDDVGSISCSRRLFVVSLFGAASMLAFSEGVAADSTDYSWQEPIQFTSTSTIETSTTITALKNDAVATAATSSSTIDTRGIIEKAAKKALGGGKAGAAAAVVQVLSLMWLRTSMNYQYRFGGTLSSSLKTLYNEGGISRLYQGLPFALIQGPLTRFGDTAANTGMLALLESIPETSSLPLPIKTAVGSVSAGIWRIFLMPIDTSKTVLQVEGADGWNKLREKIMESGPSPLYQGAVASAAATAAGHFPWFLTFNFLNDKLPVISKEDDLLLFLVRSAALGLSASCVSDCVSNSLRVIKTTKQTASLGDNEKKEISYQEALAMVLETDGVSGLFGRGLQTRLLTNAIQGALFSVLWKYFLAAS
ncbi:hypothetical protein ACHAWU_007268 [Discostella pseudostelligera]|uniref:Mitochondrial carrier protein n=1 Tax=Discostella pseudostelligera TaxID=259834 RepID=A0ABD3LY43_9STRA